MHREHQVAALGPPDDAVRPRNALDGRQLGQERVEECVEECPEARLHPSAECHAIVEGVV